MDTVSRNMISEIEISAEARLGRKLTASEKANISKPRGYIGLESILDYLRDCDLDAAAAEEYLKNI